jgi:hypothetical protein
MKTMAIMRQLGIVALAPDTANTFDIGRIA